MEPVPSNIEKTYPARGPLQQYRFTDATAFRCFRCGESKKSKLMTVYRRDWSRRLCNGCYGRLLSLYDVKAGTDDDDVRADQLAAALFSLVERNQQKDSERLLLASETRATKLSPEALRFLATAEFLATRLAEEPDLEWSPAIIGLCKAFETEVVNLIVRPLAEQTRAVDLSEDRKDKDLGRVASFCADPTRKPPELGVVGHFLMTAFHSERRRETSPILRAFFQVTRDWSGSHWLLDRGGLADAIGTVTTRYRNRAAHIDELAASDYRECRELVAGAHGALWQLALSVERHK